MKTEKTSSVRSNNPDASGSDAAGNHTNPDAITGAPASHPGATAIGSASGAATGAAIGAVGGPAGAIIGAIAGGVIGGWTGHSIGEWHDPSDEAYWKENYKTRDYYDKSANYDQDVVPALQYGSALGGEGDIAATDVDRPLAPTYNTVEDRARAEWESVRGKSKYSYDQARSAINDAYSRKAAQRRSESSATSADELNS
jgi:uncharacterized protein YcfJ